MDGLLNAGDIANVFGVPTGDALEARTVCPTMFEVMERLLGGILNGTYNGATLVNSSCGSLGTVLRGDTVTGLTRGLVMNVTCTVGSNNLLSMTLPFMGFFMN